MSSIGAIGQIESTMSNGSLQSSATANGDGTSFSVEGYCTVLLSISGSIGGGTTVNFEGRTTGGIWTALQGTEVGTGTLATTATVLGLWSINIAGLTEIRARISNYGSGSVNVDGVATVLTGPNTSNEVTITSLPLPANAAQETGGNLATIAGAVSSSKMQVNLSTISGNSVNTGNGTAANCPRVSIASDNSSFAVSATLASGSSVIGALTANQSVNLTQIDGTSVNTGNGTAANCPRVSIASDNSSFAVSATIASGSNVIGALTANQSVNLTQLAGSSINTGNGTAANCPRVTIASDNTSFAVSATLATGSSVIGSLIANQSVNLAHIAGSSISTGNGTAANCPRVTIASDNSSFAVSATLATGSNVIGALSPNQSMNLAQVAGNTVNTGNGTASGSPRVTIANDNAALAVSDSNLAVAQNSSSSSVKGPMVQGVCTTSAPTYSNGNVVPLSFTTGGALRVDSGGGGGGAVTQSGTWQVKLLDAGGTNLASISSAGAVKVDSSINTATYIATCPKFTITTTSPTDIIVFGGSSSKLAKILSMRIYASIPSASTVWFQQFTVIKRTTANSAGTSVSPVSMDSTNAAATCTLQYYTSNPTLGSTTNGGTMLAPYFQIASGLTNSGEYSTYELFQAIPKGQPITVRGTSEQICLNLGGVTPYDNRISVQLEVIWTEE